MKLAMEALAQNLPFTLGGYNFVQVLGSGGFSTVFKVVHLSSGQFFAAKACSIDKSEKHKRNVALAEMNSLKTLYHPNIIKIYDIIEGYNFIFMILEFMGGGSAKSIIPKETGIRYNLLISSIKQILSAVEFCHSQNIAHRDIKPDNILFDETGRCVLSDFGLSCTMKDSSLSNDFSGSLPYKSPEILKHREYDPFKADMWALGVTFYYMAIGELPWDRSGDMKKMIVNSFYLIPKRVPAVIQYIIRSTLVFDPTKRATAKKLLELPVFSGQIDTVPISEAGGRASLALTSIKNSITSVSKRRLNHKSMSLNSLSSFLDFSNLGESSRNEAEPVIVKPEVKKPLNKIGTMSIICPQATFIDNTPSDDYSSRNDTISLCTTSTSTTNGSNL